MEWWWRRHGSGENRAQSNSVHISSRLRFIRSDNTPATGDMNIPIRDIIPAIDEATVNSAPRSRAKFGYQRESHLSRRSVCQVDQNEDDKLPRPQCIFDLMVFSLSASPSTKSFFYNNRYFVGLYFFTPKTTYFFLSRNSYFGTGRNRLV